jgi:hypothetical protein
MGLSSWLGKKIFSDENLGYLIEKTRPLIQSEIDRHLKESVLKLMEDEDIAYGVGLYTDALYKRVSKKFFGAIGGVQKGVNYQTGEIQDNILDNVFQDGQINVMGILKLLLSGQLKGLGSKNRPTGINAIPSRFKIE